VWRISIFFFSLSQKTACYIKPYEASPSVSSPDWAGCGTVPRRSEFQVGPVRAHLFLLASYAEITSPA